jgi:preprotein translocase subunit SecY
MFQTLVQAFKSKDLRKKLLLTLGILFIYRIGCWLPIPGLNTDLFKSSVGNSDFLSLLSSVNGGALSNGAILALGVIPYISASIIIQLLTVAVPALERLSRAGEEGRRKITLYTRITALVFALIQAIAIVLTFSASGSINETALSSNMPAGVFQL